MEKNKVHKTLDEIADELIALPSDEWHAMMLAEDNRMKEAIIKGTEHIGLVLWYSQDPKECQEYVDKVMKEHKESLK